MTDSIAASHQVVKVASSFAQFTKHLEAALGHLDRAMFGKVETEPAMVEAYLKQLGGEQDLVLFGMEDHGALLTIAGAPRRAKQYAIGNPLIAMSMTQHDMRAALYAPLRVLVYEAADQKVRVEYDLPSSLFGQFGNAAISKVADSLDAKLAALIASVDEQGAK
ncbi:hypothetical protein GCM10028824_42270 [Hymenobacter segetis]|uniref:DUF302 domain-containing protein n=1 Tax=Hymenobacter segetis TaxID=2025509 RepID=A0ABU9M2J9_9BACT